MLAPARIHLPGFEKPRRDVCDPLDPGIFWETRGGRRWLCTAPLDRPRDSVCPQPAGEEKLVLALSGWNSETLM